MQKTTPSASGSEPALDARALATLVKTRNFSTERVALLFHLKEMIRLSMGVVLGQWRDSRDPVSGAFAEHCQAEIQLAQDREVIAILRARFARMPPAQRKRYSPEERFRIVRFVGTYGLTFRTLRDRFSSMLTRSRAGFARPLVSRTRPPSARCSKPARRSANRFRYSSATMPNSPTRIRVHRFFRFV